MATYNLQQLDLGLIAAGYDQTTRAQVENYLISHGYFGSPVNPTGPTIDLENTVGVAATNLLVKQGTSYSVQTGAGGPNPNLSYILDPVVSGSATVTVTGSGNVGISAATGNIDLILSDSGNDVVYTGSGTDTINASASTGADTLYASGSGRATITGGTGADVIAAEPSDGKGGVFAGGGGGELISSSTSGGPATIITDTGAPGQYTLQGGAGNDSLYSSNATGDTLIAGTGDNFLESLGQGSNSLVGGSGNDTLWSNSSGNDTLQGGSGHNVLVAIGPNIPGQSTLPSAGSGQMISGSTAGSWNVLDDYSTTAHTLTGGAGADTLYSNNSNGDHLNAGIGNNQVLQAFVGNNSLDAGSNSGSSDSLYAGAGNDTLNASSDTNFAALYSGAGNSTLEGSDSTVDYFGIANHGNGHDTVTIDVSAGSTQAFVDMGSWGAAYASTDATSTLPAPGSTNPNLILTFSSGQTIDINAGAGNTITLEFTDPAHNITYKG